MNRRVCLTLKSLIFASICYSDSVKINYTATVYAPEGDTGVYSISISGTTIAGVQVSPGETKYLGYKLYTTYSWPYVAAVGTPTVQLASSPYTSYPQNGTFIRSDAEVSDIPVSYGSNISVNQYAWNVTLFFDVYVKGYVPPTDHYSAEFNFDNADSETNTELYVSVWIDYGPNQEQIFSDYISGPVSINWEQDVIPDSSDPQPIGADVVVQTSLFPEQVGTISQVFTESGVNASGGHDYELTYYQVYDGYIPETGSTNEVDPETPPMPIDPTDPPEGIGNGDAPPESVGGDESAGTAENYVDFRNAMIDALDARHLSQEELQVAYENALKNQNLSGTNMYKAFKNALIENGMSQEKQRDAMQSALDRQGLSGSNLGNQIGNQFGRELDERDLTADLIGQAVAEHMNSSNGLGGVVSKLDEISGKLGGESLGSLGGTNIAWDMTVTNAADTGLIGTATNMVGKSSGLMDFVEDWFGNFFVLDLPGSLGKQTVIEFDLPDNGPGGVILFPESVRVDLNDFNGIAVVRMIELAVLHVFGVYTAVRIYKSCW